MQYCHRSLRPACARQTTSVRSPRTSRRAFLSILVAACTLDMASRILPERTVPMPSGRQIVSPANDREVGPRRALLDGAEPWVLQLQRPPPMAETGSCRWSRGQRDASKCDAAAGYRNPSLFAEKAPSTRPTLQPEQQKSSPLQESLRTFFKRLRCGHRVPSRRPFPSADVCAPQSRPE